MGPYRIFIYDGRVFFKDDNDKRKWSDWTLNSLSTHEATVRGATVWFDHPNYDYSLKAKRSWNRYVQLQEV